MTVDVANGARWVRGISPDRANRERDDYYPTPAIATELLLAHETFTGPIWEPACGCGAISKVLEARGHDVVSTDLVDRGYGTSRVDFLMEQRALAPNIITNPPFKCAEHFLLQSLRLADRKVAFLCRLAWLEGVERGRMFRSSPLARVHVFSFRLSIQRGKLDDKAKGGMVAFAWYVFDKAHTGAATLNFLQRPDGPVAGNRERGPTNE